MHRALFPEDVVKTLLAVLESADVPIPVALEAFPIAIYVTDADGLVLHFNQAAAEFAGRRPVAGQDRWCVIWKLYTEDGTPLPHEHCPMAVAIRTRKPVRGVTAIAERPDGLRVRFQPFPTPFFAKDGTFGGAVNVVMEVKDATQLDALQLQVARCRRLAASVGDKRTAEILSRVADEYEAQAGRSDVETLH